MRHRVEGRKFGRETGHRNALLHNLVKSLITYGRITTTLAKAKEMRGLAERLVTYGKKGEIHHRRLAYQVLQDNTLVKKLFTELAPRFANREGGYTRILKMGYRRGDCAPIAIIEFVDNPESVEKVADKPAKAKKPTQENIKAADLTKDITPAPEATPAE